MGSGRYPKKIPPFFINVALVAASLCLALVLLELLLPFVKSRNIEEAVYQARRPVVQGMYGAYHPQLRFTLQKNLRNVRIHYPGQLDYTLDTNAYGFRGPDWDLSPRRKNIVILGDSFAFGWGVSWDQTAGRVLERALQARNPDYQVINLAMPGYSLDEVVSTLALFRDQLKPVAVIYMFCPNDVESMKPPNAAGAYDLEYHPRPGDEEAFQAMVKRNQPGYWSWDKFRRRSYLKALHARIIRPLFSQRIKNSLRIDPVPEGYDFPPPLAPVKNPPLSAEARFLRYGLERLHTLNGGALYLTTTSDKSIIYKKDQPDNLRWVLNKFSEETSGTVFVDFESFARRTPEGRKFYLDFDDHWSSVGHGAAASLILEQMIKRGFFVDG